MTDEDRTPDTAEGPVELTAEDLDGASGGMNKGELIEWLYEHEAAETKAAAVDLTGTGTRTVGGQGALSSAGSKSGIGPASLKSS